MTKSLPERIWAWYDAEYEVVTGSLSKKTHEPSVEYVRADLAAKGAEIARLRDGVLSAAVKEYDLCDNLAGKTENLGRKAAVRGMMVRLGLYAEFLASLEDTQ